MNKKIIYDGKMHKYYVDFKIKNNNGKIQLVEIKGNSKYFKKEIQNGSLKEKIKSAIKYSKNNRYDNYLFLLNGINWEYNTCLNI